MKDAERGQYVLAIVRIMIGWLFIWGFLDKMFGLGLETPAGSGVIDGVSPSSMVVYVSKGLFQDLFFSMAGNIFVDILLMIGLLILGITITLGVGTKLTTIFSIMFFLTMYCLVVPPTDNPIIDYHIILSACMVAIYLLGGYEKLSFYPRWKDFFLVKRYPIIE